MKKLIGIEQLSERIGIAVGTIYSWTHMRVIPFYKIGRLVRFDEVEIEDWLKKRKQPVSEYAHLYWKK